jgi:hypothetical protein
LQRFFFSPRFVVVVAVVAVAVVVVVVVVTSKERKKMFNHIKLTAVVAYGEREKKLCRSLVSSHLLLLFLPC